MGSSSQTRLDIILATGIGLETGSLACKLDVYLSRGCKTALCSRPLSDLGCEFMRRRRGKHDKVDVTQDLDKILELSMASVQPLANASLQILSASH